MVGPKGVNTPLTILKLEATSTGLQRYLQRTERTYSQVTEWSTYAYVARLVLFLITIHKTVYVHWNVYCVQLFHVLYNLSFRLHETLRHFSIVRSFKVNYRLKALQ